IMLLLSAYLEAKKMHVMLPTLKTMKERRPDLYADDYCRACADIGALREKNDWYMKKAAAAMAGRDFHDPEPTFKTKEIDTVIHWLSDEVHDPRPPDPTALHRKTTEHDFYHGLVPDNLMGTLKT
ncbi:hypothetical protein DFQ27_001311, partial [Actinomortierella ambigua]